MLFAYKPYYKANGGASVFTLKHIRFVDIREISDNVRMNNKKFQSLNRFVNIPLAVFLEIINMLYFLLRGNNRVTFSVSLDKLHPLDFVTAVGSF
jgi:hypothetical protein